MHNQWSVNNPEAATPSRDRNERPRPMPWPRRPERPDVGDGPFDRLTLAAAGTVEAPGQLIHQVACRIGERPAFPPGLRVTAVVDSSPWDVHPITFGDDHRVARVVTNGVSSSRCNRPASSNGTGKWNKGRCEPYRRILEADGLPDRPHRTMTAAK
jgi:hypothetical protein